MTDGRPILVRADASAAIGMGHVMRCLALVQALADERGGRAAFLMAAPQPAFTARAARERADVLRLAAAAGTPADAAETLACAAALDASWIVLDGYHFDGDYQRALVEGGRHVLAFDDHAHAGVYHAHVVLNQNLGAEAGPYERRAQHTRLLLGPQFALLRREFRSWNEPPRPIPARARRVLVTLGGSDPDDVSSRVLRALAAVRGPLEVELLIGATNPHGTALQRAIASCPHPVARTVDALDVPWRMARADLAVAGAGGTSWELARVGTPQVALVLADNQRPAGRALASAGLALSLGWHADVSDAALAGAIDMLVGDRAHRVELARRGREQIDGQGALRVLEAMALAGVPA
jgi:UDP-2,4-diacetamido-2,4,6-trideoxy-beta-L-altropyranose hydrolase